jgi:hypothetical protein
MEEDVEVLSLEVKPRYHKFRRRFSELGEIMTVPDLTGRALGADRMSF